MAQVVVRQLEEDVKERLRRRAKRHGRSATVEASKPEFERFSEPPCAKAPLLIPS